MNISSDIIIHTFGYGQDHDYTFLSQLSKIRDGGYYFVEYTNKVKEMFIDALGGLMSINLKNISVSFELNNDLY